MATPALRSGAGQFDQLFRLLEPFPGRLEFAARVAAICALTALVVEIYQTPDAALTTYVVFFLNKPDRTTSLILSVAMMLLLALIIGLVFVVATVVIDDPSWRVASMAALSFGFLFLASASKLRPVGATMTLIAAYALDLLGSVPGGEVATRGLLYAWLFVGIPAGASIAVNLLFAPSPTALCERELARRLRLAAAMLRAPDEGTRREFTRCLREANGEIEKRLKLAFVERSATAAQIEALRRAAWSSLEIISLIDVVESEPDAAFPCELRGRLAFALDSLAGKTYAGAPSVKVDFESAVAGESSLSPLAAEVVSCMKRAIAAFAEADPMSSPERERATLPAPEARKSSGFFLPDAFTNPDHVRYALKTTAAAMFCYVSYTLLDWPGIHTCFLTCYIVSLETTAETIEKLTLRISGCLIGSAAGYTAIVFLAPSLTSIGDLMTVVFLGAMASAWVSAGSPRISYAGYQIAFAFFLCVIQGPSPSFDLVTARDRVIGVLFGNLAVYLLFTNVFPVSVARRIDDRIAATLRRLASSLKGGGRALRGSDMSELQQMLGGVEEDIEVARYEPLSTRPPHVWLERRRRAVEEISALLGMAQSAVADDCSLAAATGARLDRLADELVPPDPVRFPPGEEVAAWGEASNETPGLAQHPFRERLEKRLEALEEIACVDHRTIDRRSDHASP
ncbi:MAG TPA: FUSC family protein [Methylocystis sp.]|nr:FUSC family protein [Methylocystis sp.]